MVFKLYLSEVSPDFTKILPFSAPKKLAKPKKTIVRRHHDLKQVNVSGGYSLTPSMMGRSMKLTNNNQLKHQFEDCNYYFLYNLMVEN